MNRVFAVVVACAVALGLAASSMFIVHQGQDAVVFSLGKVRSVLREPGLYLKWPTPVDNVLILDRRGLLLRSNDAEHYATHAQRELIVAWTLRWHITDPAAFVRTFGGSMSRAESQLHDAVQAALGAQIGAHSLAALLGKDNAAIDAAVQQRVAETLRASGVSLDGFGLSRVDLGADLTKAVYARMSAERRAVASRVRAQGSAEAEDIRAKADRQRTELLAKADAQAQRIEGEGDAKAAAIDAAAYGQDPQFASFYRSLAVYRASFNQPDDLLVLDGSSAFLRDLRDPGTAATSPLR